MFNLDTNNLFAMMMAQGGQYSGTNFLGTKKTKNLIMGSLIGGLLTKTAGMYFQSEYEIAMAKENAKRLEISIGVVDFQMGLSKEQYQRFRDKFSGTVAARTAKMGLEFTGSPIEVLVDSLTQIGIDEALTNYQFAIQKSNLMYARQRQEDAAKLSKYNMIAGIVSTVASAAGAAYMMRTPKPPKPDFSGAITV